MRGCINRQRRQCHEGHIGTCTHAARGGISSCERLREYGVSKMANECSVEMFAVYKIVRCGSQGNEVCGGVVRRWESEAGISSLFLAAVRFPIDLTLLHLVLLSSH